MKNAKMSMAVALLILFVLACTCGKKFEFNENNSNNTNNTNNTNSSKSNDNKSNDNESTEDENKNGNSNDNTSTTGSNQSTGIAECDAYLNAIEKYLKCPNVPEASRQAYRKQKEDLTRQIREVAKNDTGKAIMAGACKNMVSIIEDKIKEECK